MDVIDGLHDLLNPVPLLVALATSHTVRIATLKLVLTSILYILIISYSGHYLLPLLSPYSPINLYALHKVVLKTGFSIVPPLLSASFKKDLAHFVKKSERSALKKPYNVGILDTMEKIVFITTVNVCVSVLARMIVGSVGQVLKQLVSSCIAGFYFLEPRFLADGISYRRQFNIVEAHWLYMMIIGGALPILTMALSKYPIEVTIEAMSIWQSVVMFNAFKRARRLLMVAAGKQQRPGYPRLPLFAVPTRAKAQLIDWIRPGRKKRLD
jgi:hypothetical protein